ncbi:MAG: NAD-dependent succinate-semialdehyde dehydrogenase, partial [Bacteroidota bacterium]
MQDIRTSPLFQHQCFIDGQWTSATSGKVLDVVNPFSGAAIGQVPDMGVTECRAAIDAAHRAFAEWRKYSAGERATILKKWYALQMEHQEALAQLLTTEQGKPIAEARGEVRYGASFVEWFAAEAQRIYGEVIPGQSRDKRITVVKQPIGVVGAITPWNFPNAMITRKVAPALAAGCTVVIKPSELTPFSALALAEWGRQAGFPPGVLNVVTTTDAPAFGHEFTHNPKVKKLSFTGSTRVGKILLEQAAGAVKKVSLELGGNAPFIVFADADIDAAVEGAIASKFRNAGQTCVCANRFFAHADIYDEFVTKLTAAVGELKLGNGLEAGVNIGPMISDRALKSVENIVADACAAGAKVVIGGQVSPDHPRMYQPTIIAEATRDMRLFREEIFGPVAPVYKFETEAEVIELANDTEYGLASYFYGNDYRLIWR